MDKDTSLFCHKINDKEKSFITFSLLQPISPGNQNKTGFDCGNHWCQSYQNFFVSY
jgi:hypothetical protein